MKPEQQRIKIAEACGAPKDSWWCDTCKTWIDPEHVTHSETHDSRYGGCGDIVFEAPDYLHDLNAMHEAEKLIRPSHKGDPYNWGRYCELLDSHCTSGANRSATAAQRAEAFLKTLGLWTYD